MLRVVVRDSARGRVLCFDLESRPSAHWYGDATTSEITAFGWKWLDEPEVQSMALTATGRFQDHTGKRLSAPQAYRRFVQVLGEAAIVYGHNIRRFDLPLLNAGLMRLGEPVLEVLHRTTDTLKDLPKTHELSRSLDSFAAMLELGKKLGLSIPEWEDANKLTQRGLLSARERVETDVLLQERLRLALIEKGWLGPTRVWRP